jgi:hypothetical protein
MHALSFRSSEITRRGDAMPKQKSGQWSAAQPGAFVDHRAMMAELARH